MTTKENFIKTMQVVGFNHRFIKHLVQNLDQVTDFEDIMSLIAARPNISEKTLLKYVTVMNTLN